MVSETAPDAASQDQKLKAIQKAAFDAFQTYGFRRTSMEDIARGAGMSRSALYLHFRNKEDIFRSLVSYYYDENAAAMAAALEAGSSPEDALIAGLAAKDGQIMEAILASPHGAEIMDTGFALSKDLAQAGEARFAALLADWLGRMSAAGAISIDPDMGGPSGLAETVLGATKGLKQPGLDPETYTANRDRLARITAKALRP